MHKSLYLTGYEFKKDIQKELGRNILNQEWLRLKPEEPLPWNGSYFQKALLELLCSEKQVHLNYQQTQEEEYLPFI